MSDDAQSKAGSHEVDIDRQRLGIVYANALIGAAEAQQQSDVVVDELDALIDEILTRSPEFDELLASPRVAAEEKAALLDKIFGDQLSGTLLTFLKVVGRNGRLDCLREIRAAARAELNRLRHRVAVHVTTAEAINDDLKGRIAEQLRQKTGHDVDLVCHVDASIIGGMVVRIGDTVYDSSVANQLARMKQDALTKTFSQLRESIDRFAVTG